MGKVHRTHRTLWLALIFSITLLAIGRMGASAQTTPDGQLEQGASLFAENCAVCHGPKGEGRIGATLAKDWPSVRPDLTVKTIIENGVPGSVMPAWSQANGGPLSQEQIDALVAYILSWQTGGASNIVTAPTYAPRPPITPVPEVEGDPNHGALLFDQNCAVCHGPNGEGRIGATLAKPWPSVRPDLTVKTTIQNGVPGSVMPAWGQANGGPLSDQDVNDLVSFVLSRPPVGQVEAAPTTAAPGSLSWLSGWGGVLLFFVLFIVVIAGALILQRR